MGNNQSVSSTLVEFCNISNGNIDPSLNSFLPSSENAFSSNNTSGFIEDNGEEFLAQVIHQIMAKDEVLAIIRRSIGEPVRKKAKKNRTYKGRCTTDSLQNSLWGQLMSAIQEEIAEKGMLPQSDLQKTFRLRFRVPYSMFVDIVQECVDANVFGGTGKRKPKIGVDFKVLTCLRILGRNFVCDSVVEILNTGVMTVNNVFKDFAANYSAAYYDKYVYVPEGADLDKVEKDYRYMGFPGCVGSMDVTHLHWGACPKHLRHHCIGRYGHPTVAFNFVCAHTRRIHHISTPFYGATNDITISYNDNYPRKLMLCQQHQQRVFKTFNRNGDVTYWQGAYLITDGGYPTCYSFVNPNLPDYAYHSVLWAEWLESIRKDVERCFGTLKMRFRWLIGPIAYHELSTIANVVKVCAILHNRLLEYDGMLDFDWDNIDDSNDNDDDLLADQALLDILVPLPEWPPYVDPDLPAPSQMGDQANAVPVPSTMPIPASNNDVPVDDEINFFANSNHTILKASLIKHITYAYTNGQLHWPKTFPSIRRRGYLYSRQFFLARRLLYGPGYLFAHLNYVA